MEDMNKVKLVLEESSMSAEIAILTLCIAIDEVAAAILDEEGLSAVALL